jgi:hypothetical protein
MKREHRYLVVKIKDMARYMSESEAIAFLALATKIDVGRARDGKGPVECVCVESDWPEYEPTWAAIEKRVDGQT